MGASAKLFLVIQSYSDNSSVITFITHLLLQKVIMLFYLPPDTFANTSISIHS